MPDLVRERTQGTAGRSGSATYGVVRYGLRDAIVKYLYCASNESDFTVRKPLLSV